jgi:sugar phosphate permease
MRLDTRTAVVAWMITAVYYFYQYTLRSAPAVMMPQLAEAFGVSASGAAMLPYTVIKEVNPVHVSGTSTGVVNFLNFTFSALLGPVLAWMLTAVGRGATPISFLHYQTAFQPLLYGVALAILLTIVLRETGPAVRPPVAAMESAL